MHCFKSSQLGTIPEGWVVTPLVDAPSLMPSVEGKREQNDVIPMIG